MSTEITFRKVSEPYGWLGNMSPHPITILAGFSGDDRTYRTAEHLFQAMRFANQSIRDEIIHQTSPMAAKMVAKKYADQMSHVPRSEQDVQAMRFVLLCKLKEHPFLKIQLLQTEDATIIEDCSARANESGLFWGAARSVSRTNGSTLLPAHTWRGENRLGRLWMELRSGFSPGGILDNTLHDT